MREFLLILFGSCFALALGQNGRHGNAAVVNRAILPGQVRESRVYTFENWKDWNKWKAPQEVTEALPFYQSGYDMEGIPVYVLEYGKWNYRDLAWSEQQMEEAFQRYFEQRLRRIERETERDGGQGIVLIVDWKGFNLKIENESRAARLALEMFSKLSRIQDVVKYGYFINTNAAAKYFLEAARPFLGDILEKFQTYDIQNDMWRSELLNKIPAGQLPPRYGGFKNPEPIVFSR